MEPPTKPITHGPTYSPPDWSSLPPSGYSLEVIKNGTVISELPLQKAYYRFGRQPDAVDIPLDHGSISRLHAVVNFRKDGAVLLIDMGSANGTFVNKDRLTPKEYRALRVGDVIRFGESTRIYALKGPQEDVPAEEESPQLQQLRQKAEERDRIRKERRIAEENAGVSWGMPDHDEEIYKSMQDEEENSSSGSISTASKKKGDGSWEDEDPEARRRRLHIDNDEDLGSGKIADHDRFRSGDRSASAQRMNLPAYLREDEHYDRKYGEQFSVDIDESKIKTDKDRELVDKIRKKERKIQNLQDEIRRIYMKEHQQDEGLTAGQQAAVTRNDSVIAQLMPEVQELVQRWQQKHYPVAKPESTNTNTSHSTTEPTAATTSRKRSLEDDDGVDGVYDTSAQTADVSTNWRLRKKMSKLSSAANMVATAGAAASSSSGSASAVSGSNGAGEQSGHAVSHKEIRETYEREHARQLSLQKLIQECEDSLRSKQQQATSVSDGVEAMDHWLSAKEIEDTQQQLQRLRAELVAVDVQLQPLQRLLQLSAPSWKPSNNSNNSSSGGSSSVASKDIVASAVVPVSQAKRSYDEDEKAAQLRREREQEETLREIQEFAVVPDSVSVSSEHQERRRDDDRSASQAKAPAVLRGPEARIKGPASRLVAANPQQQSSSSVSSEEKAHTQAVMQQAVRQGLLQQSQVLEGGDMLWVPPNKTQRANDKTSLHAKLGY